MFCVRCAERTNRDDQHDLCDACCKDLGLCRHCRKKIEK